MKLVTFTYEDYTRIGALLENTNRVVDLNSAYQTLLKYEGKYRYEKIAEAYIPANMKEFLQGGKESMSIAKKAISYSLENENLFKHKLLHDFADVKIEAPLPEPGKMICVGHNYKDHILEMGRELPANPVLFAKFANTVIGPQDDIPFYPISEQLDYEAEFAFIIGKRARNVSRVEALDYVAGYTIANDITYRDIQRRTLQWLQGKSVEGSAPMGPYLVTTDELTNPSGLEMVLSVNGEERQRANTDNLVFDVENLVEFLSHLMTLEPGDIILTGTPGGVGFARNPQTFLKDGDVVRIEVEQIGVLENRVSSVKENSNG